MFGPRHYMPVLKVKRAEKDALASLELSLRRYVVPLLEIVERKNTLSAFEHLSNSFRGLALSLHGYSRFLLDVQEIRLDGSRGAYEAFTGASEMGIPFTPVTGISRSVDVAPAMAFSSTNGVGIRLTRKEFEAGSLTADLNSFLSAHGLAPDRVDLIVDLGSVERLITVGVMSLTDQFLADIPNKSDWRTLTVTASAFPSSMGVVNRNSSTRIERSEWLAWRRGLFDQRARLERLPTFSDCAIQHPVGVEGFDPQVMQPSATIRYTSDSDWLLVKGESTKSNPAKIQFPKLATQLVYGHIQHNFAGEGHCTGCQMARESANGSAGRGSPQVWRRIGTIHHITTVVRDDLDSLPWP